VLPIQRLSPKNQVTLSRDMRALASADGATVEHLLGIQHGLAKSGGGEMFPIIILMTEPELRRREDRILADPALDGATRLALVTKLNGGAARMAIDGQNRIVLPPHFVAYLSLERDIFLNGTNTTVQIWNPQHYLRWSGRDAGVVVDPLLTSYLPI
jgi:hypothetical protein